MTVQLYVLPVAALTSLVLSLTFSHKTAALLPLNKVPIIGQPVADIIHGVNDGLVRPAVRSVTSVLPTPIGNAVQAPVNALNRVVDPVIGPSSQPAPNRQARQGSQQNQTDTATNQTLSSGLAEQQRTDGSDTSQVASQPVSSNYPKLSSNITPLDKHTPVLGIATKSFAKTKDPSTVIAAGSVLLAMTLLFVSLVTMIIRSHIRSMSYGEHVLMYKDLAQASALVAGLILLGSLLLYVIIG